MAEEEVNYASLAFKSNNQPGSEVKKTEETVYDDVKMQNKATEQPPDTNASAGVLPDKNSDSRCRHYQQLACCLGILSIMLVVGIIAASVYFTTFIDENVATELRQLKENQTTLTAVNRNLTALTSKLRSDNDDLKRNQTELRLQIHNQTQASTVLKNQVTNLTAETQNLRQENKQLETEKQELETQKQELETDNKNLTEQIQHMKTSWKENNVSRAQWSIDAYCPKENNNRQCKPCPNGWMLSQSSCYAVNNPDTPGQKTWEEARDDCRVKSSDLVVVINADEKKYVSDSSWGSSGVKGYWIGLRVEDGKWKWVDGSDLIDNSWIQQPPSNGSCAISVQNQGFQSVSCNNKNRWICEKKSVSV